MLGWVAPNQDADRDSPAMVSAPSSKAGRCDRRSRTGDPALPTYRPHAKGLDAILKKVGEEATEVVIAAKGGERAALVSETADLWFHCLVALAWRGIPLAEVLAELARREGRSGIEEKAARPKGRIE